MSDNPFIKKAREKAVAQAREEKPNPFLRAPKGKGEVKPKGPQKMSEAEWDKLRADGHALLREAGVKIGDTITVTWDYDRAYGPGTAEHTGVVEQIEDVLIVSGSNRTSGKLRMPVTGLKHVKIVPSDDDATVAA